MKQAIYTKSLTIALSPEQYAQIKDITDEKHISIDLFTHHRTGYTRWIDVLNA